MGDYGVAKERLRRTRPGESVDVTDLDWNEVLRAQADINKANLEVDTEIANLEWAVVEAAVAYRTSVLQDVAPDAPPAKTMGDLFAKPHATMDLRVNSFARTVDALIAAREKAEKEGPK